MSKALYHDGELKDIGDAIRAQLGVTTKYLPGQMAAAVRSISGGNASQSYTPHEPGDEVLVDEAHMAAIGDAIRDKLGVSTRYLPGQMAAAIRSIGGEGGSGVVTYVWDERSRAVAVQQSAAAGTANWHFDGSDLTVRGGLTPYD